MPEYPLVGRELGPYRMVQGVGRGGMAEVYLAEDLRLKRQVAVKVLPAAMAMDDTFRARFEREALAAAKLQHPHILPVYDYGQQDGIPYLVMPYITGGSLSRIIADAHGPLPLPKVVQWTQEMASALQYAHNQNIIHRDVKPGNMLVGPGEHLLLSDFGIAKVLDSNTSLTSTGTSVGSPEYMAPEQAQGEADYRSDIYALGIVVFQMLTGRVPFSASTPMQVLLQHVQEPPPSPRSLNPALSPQVEAVVLRALEKDPTQRFQSASELAEALKAAATGQAKGARTRVPADDLATRMAAPGEPASGTSPHGYHTADARRSAPPDQASAAASPAAPIAATGAVPASAQVTDYVPRRSRPRSPTAVGHQSAAYPAEPYQDVPYPPTHGYAATGSAHRRPTTTRPRGYSPAEVAYQETIYPPVLERNRGTGVLLALLIVLLLIALALGVAIVYVYNHPNTFQLSLGMLVLFLQQERWL